MTVTAPGISAVCAVLGICFFCLGYYIQHSIKDQISRLDDRYPRREELKDECFIYQPRGTHRA